MNTYPGPVVRVVAMTRDQTATYTFQLSCGHAVNAAPSDQEETDQLGAMHLAYTRGEVLFTHCDQCKVAPGPIVSES